MRSLLAPALVLALLTPLHADVVFLKSGQRLEGELAEKGGTWELKSELGTVAFPKSEVERIVKSPAAVVAEAEALRTQARALFDEGTKIENDPKAANAKFRAGLDLLRKVADRYAEAAEVYVGEKQSELSANLVKTFQEMRIYRDKLASEIAPAPSAPKPEEKPEPPAPEKPAPEAAKAAPAPAPKPAKPKVDVAALLAAAKSGDLSASYDLGVYYDDEEGNPAEALKWYKPAADKSHARAQDRLGRMYLRGKCTVKQDFAEAQRWLQKSEAAGSPYATFHLATLYYDGTGVKKSLEKSDAIAEKALKKLRPLADAGEPEALCAMSWMYATGMGAALSPELSYGASKRAAEADYTFGYRQLGWKYEQGFGVAQNLDEAAKWLQKAADRGDAGAMNDMGHLHNDPAGPKANPVLNYEKCVYWYKKLIEKEDSHGYYNLGRMYMSGLGVPKNETEGLRVWRLAMKNADAVVFRHLHQAVGWVYREGKAGVKADLQEAMRYFKTSADAGFARAQFNLGDCYMELKNEREGVKWLTIAAKNGDPYAQNSLGFSYHTARGVPKDLDQAEKWYLASAQQGYDVAVKNLNLVRADKAAGKGKK